MATDSVSSLTSSRSQLGIEDFIRILSAQLNYQDPLKPMDNAEFLGQIAQFSALEQSTQLNRKIDALISTQATNQSIGLIGRSVQAETVSGTVTGQVSALTFSNGEPRLTLQLTNGDVIQNVTLAQVISVR